MGDENNIVAGGASITVGSDLGYIQYPDGVTMTVNAEMLYVQVESLNTDIVARNTKTTYEVSTILAEPTMDNLTIAYDWQNASSTGASGNQILFGGDNSKPSGRVVHIYGYVPGSGGYTRTWKFFNAVAVPGGEWKATDSEISKTPVTFHCLYSTSDSGVGMLIDATS